LVKACLCLCGFLSCRNTFNSKNTKTDSGTSSGNTSNFSGTAKGA
jgi:hypothetical protein